MIINIRGTSGSGKSTLVRSLRALYLGPTLTYHEPGRKQPLGYVHHRSAEQEPCGPPLGIVGHYETDCGGCDTISKMERIFDLALQAHVRGMDVVFEGLLISADVNRTAVLHQQVGGQLFVLALDIPIEECLDSVNARRLNKQHRRWEAQQSEALVLGQEPTPLIPREGVNPKNTIAKHKGVRQSCERLKAAGVPVSLCGRVEAYNKAKELLKL